MTQQAHEVNFDGIVGPTHNYAGLAIGNVASQQHHHETSNPKAAALQGLQKMKRLADLGVRQGVLPPQPRPDVYALRRLGFDGTDEQVLMRSRQDAPHLLAACSSASSMWAANAATVSPSADTADGRVHFTAANLASNLHRRIESQTTCLILHRLFEDTAHFAHHPPLHATPILADEGAANHMRLCPSHGEAGLEVFVFGRDAKLYPVRQGRCAAQTIARLHQLDSARCCFVAQNPQAIDAGVFHNDVIAVANENVLLVHTDAFVDYAATIDLLGRMFESSTGAELEIIQITRAELSMADVVKTYLFNSQLVTLANRKMSLICPSECRNHRQAKAVLRRILSGSNPIEQVHYVDTRQSMKNGGGPACLRLRVVLTKTQLEHVHQPMMFTSELYGRLTRWVDRHYRDQLRPDDLADPQLLAQSHAALDELTQILDLGALYPFQN